MTAFLCNYEKTLFHISCHISLNIGPIFKIRSLARSAVQTRSAWCQWRHARRYARDMTSHTHEVIHLVTETKTWRHAVGCMVFCRSVVTHCHGGLSPKQPGRICSFLAGRLIRMRWAHMPKFNNLHPISRRERISWFRWKQSGSTETNVARFFWVPSRPPCQVWFGAHQAVMAE